METVTPQERQREIYRCIRESRLEDFTAEQKAAHPGLARMGAADWAMEEVLLRLKEKESERGNYESQK